MQRLNGVGRRSGGNELGERDRLAKLVRSVLVPVAQRSRYADPPARDELLATPFVLLLGNFSSGKSSFINHYIGQPIQPVGPAPTDDGFTILEHGEPGAPSIRGAAVVQDRGSAWAGLDSFGHRFTQRLELKRVASPRLERLTLVDSPGMIDAVGNVRHDYDFDAVIRWFAERAAHIIFLFDPGNPGTTAETLNVLAASLLDHHDRLTIVLNKGDLVRSMSDYAKIFGTICWNLARVMQHKDLPAMRTIYLPVPSAATSAGPHLEEFARERENLIASLEATDDDVAMQNARRRIVAYAQRLHVHAGTLSELASIRRKRLVTFIGVGALLAALPVAALVASGQAPPHVEVIAGMGVAIGILTAITYRIWSAVAAQKIDADVLFHRRFHRELVGPRRWALLAVWEDLRPGVASAVEHGIVPRIPERKLARVQELGTNHLEA